MRRLTKAARILGETVHLQNTTRACAPEVLMAHPSSSGLDSPRIDIRTGLWELPSQNYVHLSPSIVEAWDVPKLATV